MRSKICLPLLDSQLKSVALRSLLPTQSLSQPRFRGPLCPHQYSSASTTDPERVAIIGGGIAGLASAYYLSKEFPGSKITVLESSEQTGGWIKSKRVDVPGGNVLFEQGPRTLRFSPVTAALIQELGLVKDVIYTKRSDPGAKNRYIYFPNKLIKLPSQMPGLAEIFQLARSGIFSGMFRAVTEFLKPKSIAQISDETLGSFIARRFDEKLANNLVSAVLHGIYAGDVWQLSAKRLAAVPWRIERRYGNVMFGYVMLQQEDKTTGPVTLANPDDVETLRAINQEITIDIGFMEELEKSSMISFRNGLQQLIQALQNAMEERGNIDVITEAPVQSLKLGESGVDVTTGSSSSLSTSNFDLVISTLRDHTLTPYVTVMTVNLYYSNPSLLPVDGFGYLIPQSVPFEQNPERALGVIFDSSAVHGQDTASGTKLTVMLGGHWWDGWIAYPEEAEGLDMAKSILKRHLGITDEPVAHHVVLSKDCIPQYTVGYDDRLQQFAERVLRDYQGRVRVVGSQVNGVGVNDCIRGAWNVARGCRGGGWRQKSAGLDRETNGKDWIPISLQTMAYIKREDREQVIDNSG